MNDCYLQYYEGGTWSTISRWVNANTAWKSLGDDNYNYRVVDSSGNIMIISTKTINDLKKIKQ